MRQLKMSPLTLLLFLFGLTCSQVLAEQVSEAIIGGEYAKSGEFKYVVTVEVNGRYCGGSIIAEKYILTAAHCITEGSAHIVHQPYKVIAGTHNQRDLKHAIVVHAETVYIHKRYDPRTDHNDIGILKLTHELDLSEHHQRIEKVDLPKEVKDLTGRDVVIAGFGLQNMKVERGKNGLLVELGGTRDGKLKYAHATIYSRGRCMQVYPRHIIHVSLMCAQVNQRDKNHYEGVCGGDSGGGLVLGREVVGILSSSPIACNETSRPAKYSQVARYLKMINSVINGKPDKKEVVHADVPH